MPGKQFNNNRTPRTPLPMRSQSFCLGRKASADGQLKSTNPWNNSAANSQDKANELDWDEGFDHHVANPDNPENCAE